VLADIVFLERALGGGWSEEAIAFEGTELAPVGTAQGAN
jgi:hypothetical protein